MIYKERGNIAEMHQIKVNGQGVILVEKTEVAFCRQKQPRTNSKNARKRTQMIKKIKIRNQLNIPIKSLQSIRQIQNRTREQSRKG
jgi:hypothetical protein